MRTTGGRSWGFCPAIILAGAVLSLGIGGSPALAQPASRGEQKPGPWLTLAPESKAAASRFEGVWKLAKPTTTLQPISGKVPFTAEGKARFDENKKLKAQGKIDDYDIAKSRCSAPGVPRLMLIPGRFKIRMQLNVATFDFEWNRAVRQVDFRGWPIGAPLVPLMNGQTVGRWEGEVLVAETLDISDRTLLDDLTPHTDAMKVTERFRLTDADTLEDRITIEDSAYFPQPWEAVLTYKRQPGALFPEDVCLDRHDANQPAFPSS